MKKISDSTCWIITEDLIGTKNQCIGLAQALNLSPRIFNLKLKKPWSFFTPWLGFECKQSFDSTFPAPPYPDILIISGRKSIAAARYIRKKSNGKTFTIFVQDPRISPKEFDVVVAPAHDKITGKNVFKTFASLNKITHKQLIDAKEDFPDLAKLPSPITSVLIGGKSKYHSLSKSKAYEIANTLKDIKGSLIITTSRRTGAKNTEIIKDALQNKPDCYIWDEQSPNPYFAMLGLADHILVTNDSASMMSEACSTGKPVYILPIEGHSPRLSNLQNRLIKRGAARLYEGKLENWSYKPLNDSQEAAAFVREIFDMR